MSGMPCGAKAAFASKGYFAQQRNRRGRQLGRVLASRYDEVVVDQLFAGTTQLNTALQPLMEAAERTVQLDETCRARTIVRVDADGGSLADINWLLARGYHIQGKDYLSQRAARLAQSVLQWFDDPRRPERQLGWVTAPALEYVRPVRRLAVRSRQANGQWRVGVLLSTLSPEAVLHLTGQSLGTLSNPLAVMLAYLAFYDQRGAGPEPSRDRASPQMLANTSTHPFRRQAVQGKHTLVFYRDILQFVQNQPGGPTTRRKRTLMLFALLRDWKITASSRPDCSTIGDTRHSPGQWVVSAGIASCQVFVQVDAQAWSVVGIQVSMTLAWAARKDLVNCLVQA